MLQQMLVEDKCDQVRSVCSKSLAMVINEIDDETRFTQVDQQTNKQNKNIFFVRLILVYRIIRSMFSRYTRCCSIGEKVSFTFDSSLVY